MKRGILIVAAVALGALLWPAGGMHPAAAVAATPTPVALQYDEITRMVMPPATPPAPGSFQVDFQAIMSNATATTASAPGSEPASPTPAPHHHGLGSLVGSIMSGTVPESNGGESSGGDQGDQGSGAMAGMGGMGGGQQMRQRMRMGTLTRLAYYKGWIRTDDPVMQTATISKCQEHQFISLDLAKKTYRITNTQPACHPMPNMPTGPH